MNDQPCANDTRWIRTLFEEERHRAAACDFVALRATRGIRADCTLCAEVIFARETGYEVILDRPEGCLTLYFHPHCYVRWERE
jgi:hypothetical protein